MNLHPYQQKLEEWCQNHCDGQTTKLAREAGLSDQTVRRLLNSECPLEKLTRPTVAKLYRLTKLEEFKPDYKATEGASTPLNNWQIALIEWMLEKNIAPKEARTKTGIPEETLRDYTHRAIEISRITEKSRERLYALTKLEIFNPNGSEKIPGTIPVGQAERLQIPATERTNVEETASAFYLFAKRLETIVQSPEQRKALTCKIPKPDVGRVTSLLHAMYKTDQDFDRWMFLSAHNYEGGKK